MNHKNFKKQMIRNSYLLLEEEDVDVIIEHNTQLIKEMVEKDFREYYDIIYPPNPKEDRPTNQQKSEAPESEQKSDEDLKKDTKVKDIKTIYRKISLATHPDKNNGIYEEKFLKAKRAYENNNILELFRVAAEIGIEFPEPSDKTITLMEEENNSIEEEIEMKKSTTAWMWQNLNTDEEKRSLIIFILHNLGVVGMKE
jgi:DNA primase